MKISEAIQEFVPCVICGNNDLSNFYFYVLAGKSSQAYVKCCECEEVYVSIITSTIPDMAERSREERTVSRIPLQNKNQESVHPLVKVLARI